MMHLLKEIQITNTEYRLLPFQFFLLTFWGIWSPKNTSTVVKIFYKLVFYTVFLLDIIMCTEMIIFIVKSVETHSFKLFNVFLTSASITGIYKAMNTSLNREKIRSFLKQYFDHEYLKSHSFEEDLIFEASNLRVRKVTTAYCASMSGIFFIAIVSPILGAKTNASMPFDAWYYYDVLKWYYYWPTYFHQLLLSGSLICVHISIDTLFVGLLLKLSCQLDVLKYRLQQISEMRYSKDKYLKDYRFTEKKMVCKCIEEHQMIYRLGEGLNKIFQDVLLIQAITSIPNLCINIFDLSKNSGHMNVDYITTIFCTTSALCQLFIICWFGNEIMLNSMDINQAIFSTDWTKLALSTRKLFIIQMLRSSKPIEFTVGYVIPMNIDSFIKFIKTSYSAFNLLHQT